MKSKPGISNPTNNQGRSSDLFLLRAAFPSAKDSGKDSLGIRELTATGIVPDLHRIPFSLNYDKGMKKKLISAKIAEIVQSV